jgi:hypothetical protein
MHTRKAGLSRSGETAFAMDKVSSGAETANDNILSLFAALRRNGDGHRRV